MRCEMRRARRDVRARVGCVIACAVSLVARGAAGQAGLQSSDLLKLRSVSAVQVSPDATRVAYVVDNNDGAGRPYGQLWVMTLADGKTVRVLNVNDKLADTEGKLVEGMMSPRDKLHPTLQGYQAWADALKPILTVLLGPPASTDHAPPPTGDPGARRR